MKGSDDSSTTGKSSDCVTLDGSSVQIRGSGNEMSSKGRNGEKMALAVQDVAGKENQGRYVMIPSVSFLALLVTIIQHALVCGLCMWTLCSEQPSQVPVQQPSAS